MSAQSDADRLTEYRNAEQLVLRGQRVTLEDGSTLERADLAYIGRMIDRLERRIEAAGGNGRKRGPIGIAL